MKTEQSDKNNENYFFRIFFILLEVAIVVLYGFFVDFSANSSPYDPTMPLVQDSETNFMIGYPVFQDISVMMFVGFGFLMTFLRTHSWSAVGFNFVLTAVVFQMHILYAGFWIRVIGEHDIWNEKIQIDIGNMVNALYCCGAILISFGGVIGKLNLGQLLFMA